MVSRLFKKLSDKTTQKKQKPVKSMTRQPEPDRRVYSSEELKQMKLSAGLKDNLDVLQNITGPNSDVIYRQFRLGMAEDTRAAVIYVDGMVDKKLLNEGITKPLMLGYRREAFNGAGPNLPELVKDFSVTAADLRHTSMMEDVVNAVLYGNAALLIDGHNTALLIDIRQWDTRQVSEPQSEILVRGSREGFTETMRTNTTLLRRRLRSPNLVMEDFNIGRVTYTGITIVYIRGIAAPDMVAEVKRRLKRIDIDGVLESGYLEELIEDNPYSPFPQVLRTERPDRVAAALLEGRVAILTDGTPFALVVPAEFVSLMQSPEDYYERYVLGTAVRWLRYIALAISLLLPSLYIAITTFHQEMIPTRLLIGIAAAREGVPFPALVEALAMVFTFEALREAGIRLPRAVGQAVSIVGALVIGQAAVQAGIVSPLMVIIVAVTGIASFVNPAFNVAISMRLLSFPIMLLAGVLGLFGVMVGVLAILIHLAGLRSFGVPYTASLAPLHTGDFKDVLVRAPWWAMDNRPAETAKLNSRRQARGLKPAVSRPGGRRGGE